MPSNGEGGCTVMGRVDHKYGESGCTRMGRVVVQRWGEWMSSDGESGCAVMGRVDAQ